MNHAPPVGRGNVCILSFSNRGAHGLGRRTCRDCSGFPGRMQKNDSLNTERGSPASFLCRFQPGFSFDHLQQFLLPAVFRIDVTQVGRAVVAAFELIAKHLVPAFGDQAELGRVYCQPVADRALRFLQRQHRQKHAPGRVILQIIPRFQAHHLGRKGDLLAGKAVDMPIFNFKTGKKEYKGNVLQLGPDDVLVIEGIHGLDDRLSYSLPKESKFKIYISALTQLNIDEHNRIPTTDGRLLRRIVRDARTRGTLARDTIAMWPSVRRGEEAHIFPYQEEADVMFNSALIYELAVLKVYAQPLLLGIRREEPEYQEAKRLLKFLDYFVSIPSENIPLNSLLREFVGGSCYQV